MADKMLVRAVRTELSIFDKIEVDALVLGIFADERPLRSSAGFCDWRLNGRISSLIKTNVFQCRPKETLLMDSNGYLPSPRLLLFGLGDKEDLEPASLSEIVLHMLQVSKKARFPRLALELPGVVADPISKKVAIRTLFEVAKEIYPKCEITLLCQDRNETDLVAHQAREFRSSIEIIRS